MEKEVKIKTKDKHVIYGSLTTAKKASSKLVIFCHGFTGNRNEHIHFNGAKYFTGKGYDTFRFDFYSSEKKARHFEDTFIGQHGADITTVVSHFKSTYKKIYLIGHSFGGTSLLFASHTNVNALVFWDASYFSKEEAKKEFKIDTKTGLYLMDFGVRTIIGKKFIDELHRFPDCGQLISSVQVPVKCIGAGKGKDAKKYFAKANQPKAISIITSADQNFNTFSDEVKLFEETYNWLKQY
jgi:pimeloyl-ACP methyl ester carboxylesterase